MKLMSHEKPISERRRRSRQDPNSLAGRARAAGLQPATVACRVRRGMDLEEALSKPPMHQSESASLAGKASRAAARARRAERERRQK